MAGTFSLEEGRGRDSAVDRHWNVLCAYRAATAIGIYLLPSGAQPFAAPTFFVCFAIEAFAWGMWQPWLMCAVALMVMYLQVASGASEDDRPAPNRPRLRSHVARKRDFGNRLEANLT